MQQKTLTTMLSFAYRIMVASEPLLERAIDSSVGSLHDYFVKHLEEERGHADILAADLARLGVGPIPKFHLAELIAGNQYYLIQHEHPASLLGYMAALEGHPQPLGDVDELEKQFGPLPTLRIHAENDGWHLEDIRRQIATLPPPLQSLVALNEDRVHRQLEAAPSVIFGPQTTMQLAGVPT